MCLVQIFMPQLPTFHLMLNIHHSTSIFGNVSRSDFHATISGFPSHTEMTLLYKVLLRKCDPYLGIPLMCSDLSQTSVSNLLIPTIQNLLKDVEALDPAHKEALEGILKERGGVRIADAISKAVGTSMGSLFGEGGYLRDTGYLSRTNTGDIPAIEVSTPTVPQPVPPQEEGGLKRMMRLNFLGRT